MRADTANAFTNAMTRAADADADRHIREQIAAMLASDQPPQLGTLARRDNYPTAANTLAEVLEAPSAVSALVLDSPYPFVILWRCASACGAWKRDSRVPPSDLADRLRATDAGRVALALAGHAVAPWRDLTRRERAAVLLRDLVAAMRSGTS